MNEFVGKICPYCKTPFQENDDVVVCSNCDMPHHKECWIENQGCTTFGCMGAVKAADGSANTVTTSQLIYEETGQTQGGFCTKCGRRYEGSPTFCAGCGAPLLQAQPKHTYTPAASGDASPYGYTQPQAAYTPPQQQTYAQPQAYAQPQQQTYTQPQQQAYAQPQSAYTQPQQQTYTQPQSAYTQPQGYSQNPYQQGSAYGYQPYGSVVLDRELVQLIGPKGEYYVPKFQELKAQNKSTSWNWPAFLVTPFWLFYRKMYGYGAAGIAIAFVLSLIGDGIGSLLTLAGYIVFGIFANSIYMNFLERKAQQAKTMPEPAKTAFCVANGGVNSTAVVLAVIGYVLLFVLLL